MTFRKTILVTATLVCAASAAFASDGGAITTEQRQQITERLSAEGYDVRKIEMEDGEIEVYALKDGQKLELYLNSDLSVSRIKQDD